MPDLTLSGNEITDALRALGVQGDGRTAPDSSFGIWEATVNELPNGGGETNATNWAAQGAGVTVVRTTADFKFGAACIEAVADGSVANQGFYSQSPSRADAAGTTFIGSISLKARTAGDVGKQVRIFTRVQNSDATTTDSADTTLTLPADWTRHTTPLVTVAAGKTCSTVLIMVRTLLGATLAFGARADGAQIEKNQPIATPYVEPL